jgi:prefoldin subunit 5
MTICGKYHDDVCFEGTTCPVCAVIRDKDAEIETLKINIDNIKEEISDRQEDIKLLSIDIERLNKDLQLTRDGRQDGQI